MADTHAAIPMARLIELEAAEHDRDILRARVDALRAALAFYAERQHFVFGDPDAWDTVSDEPQNYWCDEAGTATVEDGSVARAALAATPQPAEQPANESTKVFRHVRSGGIYEVLHAASLEATLEPVVVYRSCSDGSVWVRPAAEFSDGRFVAETDPAIVPQPAREPLTDGQILVCLRSLGVPAPMGLTRDRGPYEVTEPTWFLARLVRAIERAHGIGTAPAGASNREA